MKIRSIKFNFVMNSATTVVNFLFPLITFPYVSRVLEPTGYGAAEFALSTAQLFALVALLGVNTYGIRECAKVRDDEVALAKVLQELVAILGIWTIVVTIAFYASISFVPRFQGSASLFYVAGMLIPLTTIGLQWYLSACEQYAFMAVRNLVVKLIVVVAMFLFVRSDSDVMIWVTISVLATGLSSIANFAFVCKSVKLQRWRDLSFRQHLKPLAMFFLMVASISIYTTVDAVMLGYMSSDADVGYYNVAVKIKNVFAALIAALAGVLVPRAAYYLANGMRAEYIRIVNLSVHAAIIYSFFVLAAGLVFSDSIVLILAGDQYIPSIRVLAFIMPAVFFISFTQITSLEILTPQNHDKALAVTYGVAGIIDVVLNLVLIPQLQAQGAAIATTIAEAFVFVSQVLVVKRFDNLKPYIRGCLRIFPWEIASIVLLVVGRMFLGGGLAAALGVTFFALLVLVVGLGIVREPLTMSLLCSLKRLKNRD